MQQAQAAPLHLIDYVGIGAVYPTGSKSDATTPIGVSGLRDIVQAGARATGISGLRYLRHHGRQCR